MSQKAGANPSPGA